MAGQSVVRSGGRPPVSVVVPFYGSARDGEAVGSALASISVQRDDELIVVDNTPEGRLASLPRDPRLRVVAATAEQSSYHARNVGAEEAASEWLLFTDSDCLQPESWIDDYFLRPILPDCGIVAGAVASAAEGATLVARYARSRGHVSHGHRAAGERRIESFARPAGITANLLVRRAAWDAVGGFHEGIRSGGDVEFCWRAQDAGWRLEAREEAMVLHVQPTRLRPMLRKAVRWSAGRAWVNRRFRGMSPPPKVIRPLGRCAAGVAVWTLTGQLERAVFKAIDATMIASAAAGYCLSNSPSSGSAGRVSESRRSPTARPSVTIMTDAFPALSETFVANEALALRGRGHRVRVEASIRPARPLREAVRQLDISYLEDDSLVCKALSLGWLLGRHPIRSVRDRANRKRWAEQEDVWPLRSLGPPTRRLVRGGSEHVHAHFAALAALNAMRLSALTGIPYSVATHGYDIFQKPRNLAEKHDSAAFAVSDSEYSVAYLRENLGAGNGDRLHKLVLGVDGERFRRRSPYPGGRSVLAVARLVEKKGLRHLLEAAANLQRRAPLDRVRIVGGGPLQAELEEQRRRLGLEAVVELMGPRDPDAVIELLEQTDVLAMPCIVAGDGDRDTMPVVVKEALAMEVPVVATDEVGLPEVVRPEWGRLVPPADGAALADALDELLSMPREQRVEMGRAGRSWVLEHCDIASGTETLLALIKSSGGAR
ncbi:MAG: glycosyltransferase [Pyrinomonadaceae bacterium]|nr:glycosyltransferase [Pyrinomonadaceae bacterium]